MHLLKRPNKAPAPADNQAEAATPPSVATSVSSTLRIPPGVDDTLSNRLKLVVLTFAKTNSNPTVAMLVRPLLAKLSESNSETLRFYLDDACKSLGWALDAPDGTDYAAAPDDPADARGDAGEPASDAETR